MVKPVFPNASAHFDTKNVVYTLKNAMRSEIFNFLWIKIITLLQWEVLRFFLTKCANVSLIVHIIDKKTNDYEKAKERLITGIK